MSVILPETSSPFEALPATRGLGPVLRRLLEEGALSLVCGKVTALPDAKHVTVEIAGSSITVPCLANYVPQVGEGAWCLAGRSIVLAIGAASGLRPTTVPSGTATGQVLVWNHTTGAWIPQAELSKYLGRTPSGTSEQIWWGRSTVAINGATLNSVHSHGLGRTPVIVLWSTAAIAGASYGQFVGIAAKDASTVTFSWSSASGGNADLYLCVIG